MAFEHYMRSGDKVLRMGYTTGTCAALATQGAVRLLLGAEEPGLLGSKAFVFRQQEMGKIGSIRACVNFDMMGCGNEIAIRTGCGMDALVDEMIRTFEGKTGYPVKKVAVTSTSDNWNFHEAGISNLQFVGQPFPVYHLPADTMEFYDEKMVTDCIKMGIWVINKLIKSSK